MRVPRECRLKTAMDAVDRYFEDLDYVPFADWAYTNYISVVSGLIEAGGFRSVMEVGGGRAPSLKQDMIERLDVRYTSNDISERELSLAPPWVSRACFDIQTDDDRALVGHEGAYDLIFSRMVMEHVPSYRNAYRNISKLLSPTGVAIAFHPTLYAAPFVLNLMLPETLSRKVLQRIFPNRVDDGVPKFPSYYSGCVVSARLRKNIEGMGFRQVRQIPFYSHSYYRSFPGLRSTHQAVSKAIARLDITTLAAYAFTIVRK